MDVQEPLFGNSRSGKAVCGAARTRERHSNENAMTAGTSRLAQA